MNPIFNRRYKAGSRPNIMPTTKRPNFMKSIGSSSSSSSSTSSSGSSVLSDFGLSESKEDPSTFDDKAKSPISEQVKSSSSRLKDSRIDKSPSPNEEISSRTASRRLAQQLLASKQNMLAQTSLTPHENRQRSKLSSTPHLGDTRLSGIRHSFSTDNIGQSAASNNFPRSPTVHDIGGDMTICDLEYEYDDQTDFSKGYTTASSTTSEMKTHSTPEAVTYSRVSRPNLNQRISKDPLDLKVWRDLKRIVSGTGSFHDGWRGQAFTFNAHIPFGLVQKRGGPCGVLAVVQSLLIRNLLYGSTFPEGKKTAESDARLEEIASFLSNGDESGNFLDKMRKERIDCLVDAVAEIIWVCAEQRHKDEENSTSTAKECSSIIMFSDCRIQPETIRIYGKLELQHFLQNSIHRLDCIGLVYSAVLSRGIEGVKNDMDFENCSLIGQHGYCSQELINLLSFGKAISNTFDNEIELDGKVLKGIPSQCDIGLLSLFEHYDSIKVGSFLKCPRYPVWIVCSESHFSVLFSCEPSLCKQDGKGVGGLDPPFDFIFDLFYYDGLARQDKIIRLSIFTSSNRSRQNGYGSSWDQQSKPTSNCGSDEDLIPPLEKCIRTKWPGAAVDWNDTEPIL